MESSTKGDMAIVNQMIGPGYTDNGHPTTADESEQWAMGLSAARSTIR
jgi:hypothetical protein